MTNPFGNPLQQPTSPQNPRGPEFIIRTNGEEHRGRAINSGYLNHVLRKRAEADAKNIAKLMFEDVITPLESKIADLTDQLDAVTRELSEVTDLLTDPKKGNSDVRFR